MSLTTLLRNPILDAQLESEVSFPTGLVFGEQPIVPALTSRSALVGTAFDYMLRFHLERVFPAVEKREWVAEEGLRLYGRRAARGRSEMPAAEAADLPLAFDLLERARTAYHTYIDHGQLTDEVLRAVLLLAHVDSLVRSRQQEEEFGVVYHTDIVELRRLMELVPAAGLMPRSYCLLNPTFGKASLDVGGADADLLVDGTLVEVKTTVKRVFSKPYLKQLVGYYVLSAIGGIDGAPRSARVERLGVYSSRFGKLIALDVDKVLSPSALRRLVEAFRVAASEPSPPKRL